MRYTVNNSSLQYESSGEKVWGENIVLLQEAIDLTTKTSWSKKGYTVEPLFPTETYVVFMREVTTLLLELWRKAGLFVPVDFSLHQYHHIASTTKLHLAAVDETKVISTELFPVSIKLLEQRISKICKQELVVKNPFDNQSVFHFRVIRPLQNDNNPLHRDVWLEDYKDCINLYIPITGSDDNSSLIVVPESQYWPESKVERTLFGAKINNVEYKVPAVTDTQDEIEYVRPNPELNEVLVFSPYLIHGGSANLNADTTRISIEIRLWKK